MGVGTQTARAKLITAQNDKITNLSLTNASQEYSHVLQGSLKKIIIRCRGEANLQVTFTSGETDTKYFTIPRHATLEIDTIDFTGKTLYMESDTASQVAEIWEFY